MSPLDVNLKTSESYRAKLNEKCVQAWIISEKLKAPSENSIAGEYADKVLLFGYIVVSQLNN